MKSLKLKYKLITMLNLMLISLLFLFSCSNRILISKYIQDTVVLKDGSIIEGMIEDASMDPQHYYLQLVTADHTIKIINKTEIQNVYYADRLYMNDGKVFMGSIEKETPNRYIIITNKKRTIEVKKSEVHTKIDRGTPLSNIDPNLGVLGAMHQELLETTKDMGFENIITKEHNGWLYSLLGIVVVFLALTIMVVVFILLKYLPDKKEKKTEEELIEDKKELSPELIIAITSTIMVEEQEKVVPVLTISKVKSPHNWNYAGRLEKLDI